MVWPVRRSNPSREEEPDHKSGRKISKIDTKVALGEAMQKMMAMLTM